VEALVGLRDLDAEPELATAVAKAPQPWMAETLVEQIDNAAAVTAGGRVSRVGWGGGLRIRPRLTSPALEIAAHNRRAVG
jgi:hypothetical protein